MGNNFHVSTQGCDTWAGSPARPFRTIQRAADLAKAGDTVIVHEGIYREHVNPKNGGSGDSERITYEAAPGENVVISGAERITDWQNVEGNVYKTVIPNTFFRGFNPYSEIVCGDWFIKDERIFHLGEVYINGKSLFEVTTLDAVLNPIPFKEAIEPEWSLHAWYCETDDDNTTIYANFGEFVPSENTIEINARKFCFWPEKTGIDYITVRGFHLTMAAPNWAPPTALQEGLIGPHWSKGWIIENNEISNAKNSGISLGKEITTGHNEWTTIGTKQGAQRERDVIFNAIHTGWSKENIGSHIVRNNVIHDCEQTGICGHLGEVFSQIYNNHIYNVHHKRMFNGAEVAGIKLHAALDCQIRNNHIHNCDRGMWMDWQAQGTRISGNLLYDNDTADLFVEVSHGPYIVDNNIMLSPKNILDLSQGGAFIHNLFCGFISWARVTNRFTPYHYAHETGVHGLMTILGGDNRYYNNIFTGTQPENKEKEKMIDPKDWVHPGIVIREDGSIPKGLAIFNECPAGDENWYKGLRTVDQFANVRLPMYCGSNIYFGDAEPYKQETASMVCPDMKPRVKLVTEGNSVYLTFDFGDKPAEVDTVAVTTDFLGTAFEPEVPYENPDGTPLCIENDYFGNLRPAGRLAVGPFEGLGNGLQKVKVAEIK
ncbi:MAG TPA: right-handed parallel beta-helix repeat-containing protein [Clostridia bacterium]|nr:right-handed parallel beta-helix repeat-containing protein [Clostridia bacterium]